MSFILAMIRVNPAPTRIQAEGQPPQRLSRSFWVSLTLALRRSVAREWSVLLVGPNREPLPALGEIEKANGRWVLVPGAPLVSMAGYRLV
jgi:hypothetical protein